MNPSPRFPPPTAGPKPDGKGVVLDALEAARRLGSVPVSQAREREAQSADDFLAFDLLGECAAGVAEPLPEGFVFDLLGVDPEAAPSAPVLDEGFFSLISAVPVVTNFKMGRANRRMGERKGLLEVEPPPARKLEAARPKGTQLSAVEAAGLLPEVPAERMDGVGLLRALVFRELDACGTRDQEVRMAGPLCVGNGVLAEWGKGYAGARVAVVAVQDPQWLRDASRALPKDEADFMKGLIAFQKDYRYPKEVFWTANEGDLEVLDRVEANFRERRWRKSVV